LVLGSYASTHKKGTGIRRVESCFEATLLTGVVTEVKSS